MTSKTTVPKHLKGSRELYQRITREYCLELHHLKILVATCEALDRANEARELLLKDGLTFTDKHGAIKSHPAVRIEQSSKALFLRGLRELGLDLAEVEGPRPPSRTGRRAR